MIVVALRTEAWALKGHTGTIGVGRVGMGARRVVRLAPTLADASGLVSAGVAGGLVPGLETGDIIVATEVFSPLGKRPVPHGTTLAEQLRSAGLTVRTGPLMCCDRVVMQRSARAALRESGALAVDMETWALAELAGERPFVAARVVLDTDEHPLLRPGTPMRTWRALRVLRRAGPVLGDWVRATGTTAEEVV